MREGVSKSTMKGKTEGEGGAGITLRKGVGFVGAPPFHHFRQSIHPLRLLLALLHAGQPAEPHGQSNVGDVHGHVAARARRYGDGKWMKIYMGGTE